MITENKRNEWINNATIQSNLRYPKFNLRVSPYIDNSNNNYHVRFETFVSNKKGNLIVFITDNWDFNNIFDWNDLEKVKDMFLSKCELTKDKYIFNNNTAVYEPYKFNEVK